MDIKTNQKLDGILNIDIKRLIYGKIMNLDEIKDNTYYYNIIVETLDNKESNKYHNNVIFDKCVFNYCSLKSRHFDNCYFDNCYFKNLNIYSIEINNCIFVKCRINAALIYSSVIMNSEFNKCDMYFINIEQSKCIALILYKCNIRDANFVEEYLESKFEDVKFNKCKKKYAKWYLDYLYGI